MNKDFRSPNPLRDPLSTVEMIDTQNTLFEQACLASLRVPKIRDHLDLQVPANSVRRSRHRPTRLNTPRRPASSPVKRTKPAPDIRPMSRSKKVADGQARSFDPLFVRACVKGPIQLLFVGETGLGTGLVVDESAWYGVSNERTRLI